jgi:DNA polymerase I-like protein with 3'-5' exonuclease and polymerase domains
MAEVALVEKYPSGYNFNSILPFEFDTYSLTNEKIEKILKKDVTLNISEVVEQYKYVILVGKDPCKIVADIRSVTEYQGFLVEDKFLAMMNPMAVRMRPSLKIPFDKSVKDINSIISGTAAKAISEFDLRGIETEDEALKYLNELYELCRTGVVNYVALDSETSSLYPRDGYVLGISMSYGKESGVYIDSLSLTDDVLEVLQKIIDIVTILFFNAKFDMKMLEYHFNLVFSAWDDVMLIHYLLDENSSHALKPLCIKHTGLGDYDAELDAFKKKYCKEHGIKVGDFTYDLIPFDIIYKYAALDAAGTFELYELFIPHLLKNKKIFKVYENILKPGTLFLKDVEENGMPINVDTIENADEEINKEMEPLTEQLYSFDEIKILEKQQGKLFNVNSPKQLQTLLYSIMGFPVTKKTSTGNPSADAEILEELAKQHPLPKLINQIKKLKSIKSKYLDKMKVSIDRDGRIRTNFNLHTTTSGRLSSSGKLNAQQFPRDVKVVKKAIEARKGFKIVSQDLKTAEMYVASVLSGDLALQKIFIDKQDYHGSMAVQKFNLPCEPNEVAKLYPDQRQAAKTISFEILYKLNYNEPALKNFKTLKKWLKAQEEFIKEHGYIYSIFGRKRRVQDVHSPDRKEKMHQVRSAINFLVQSVSSDINLIAGINMQNWIKENGYNKKMIIFGLVHDSILAEVEEDVLDIYTKKLAEFTQADMGCSIPGHPIGLDLEIGDNYAFV